MNLGDLARWLDKNPNGQSRFVKAAMEYEAKYQPKRTPEEAREFNRKEDVRVNRILRKKGLCDGRQQIPSRRNLNDIRPIQPQAIQGSAI